jgi:hypothetical protein
MCTRPWANSCVPVRKPSSTVRDARSGGRSPIPAITASSGCAVPGQRSREVDWYRCFTVFPVGIERMSLELPTGTAPDEVEAKAAASLRAQGIRTFSELSLQTTLTTGDPAISRYTLTYWIDDHPHD